MKNKIYDLNSKKEIAQYSLKKNDLKNIIENNAFEIFRIKIVLTDYVYEDGNVDYIDSLGIDENNQIVIFEYKIGKLSRTVNNGFMQIDYIKKHSSQFKMLFNDRIGVENAKRVDYNPRLIVVGDHFHRFDYESVRLLPYMVEFDEVKMLNGQLLINHTYVNRQSDLNGLRAQINQSERDIFTEIRNTIFNYGEEIVEYGMNNVVSYRRMFNFVFVYFNNGVHLCLKGKDYLIQSFDNIEELKRIIEEEYDKN